MSAALDRFFDHYYRRRPVNATFTGMHAYDAQLPDWSREGLEALDDEMRGLHTELAVTHAAPDRAHHYRDDVELLDAELARAFLEIQLAENAGTHGVRRNPALWTGEAIFSIISLMIREFAPLDDRLRSAVARLEAIPAFLAQASATMGDSALPAEWTARALRECDGAAILLTRGVEAWLGSAAHVPAHATSCREASARALESFHGFAAWLRARPVAPESATSCGPALYDLLLARGHQCQRSRADLLADAHARLAEEEATLDRMLRETAGSWKDTQEQLAADHPAPDDYLGAFARTWKACHECASERDVVSWPDWPIRYVPFPEWTREAAPYLYYLYYRSPAPLDQNDTYAYVVPPLPTAGIEQHLRAWNHSVIKLNHVVHHGGIGHHVQNWHAYHRARSRVARVAAVDCANRIGMFSAGTMAEGWACYATELMDEQEFLTPLERISQQHSRLRFLARAIVDIEFHQGTFTFDDAIRFFQGAVDMDATVARAEVVKCSMFPGTAAMYWIGTQGILDLRAALQRKRGANFTLRSFHDELLGFGSIPVPLVARIMTEGRA